MRPLVSWLEHTYEDQAKDVVAALFGNGTSSPSAWPALDAQQTRHFTLWAVKTMLLGQHPQARRHNAGKSSQSAQPWPLDEPLLRAWRSTGELPDRLRLWVARAHDELGAAEMPHDMRAVIPATSWATFLGLGTGDGGVLSLCLVWKVPGRRAHPLAVDGLAGQLWPWMPDSIALTDLPVLSARCHQQFKRDLVRETPAEEDVASPMG